MRVIGGKWRRRQLLAPPGLATRPSSDRLRETLFNILGPRVAGASFIDAYAGSGAVGIEALSRGAASVVWIESAAPALRALHANLEALEAAGEVRPFPVRRTLAPLERRFAAAGGCDFFFLDPAYDDLGEYAAVLSELDRRTGLAGPRTQIICESRRGSALAARIGRLHRTRLHPQGDSELAFYNIVEKNAAPL